MRRLLSGEDLKLISRELGVTAAELSAWRDPSWPRVRPRSRPGRRTAGTSRSVGSRPGSAQLRQARHAFKDTYNRTWIVERHCYRTPAQIRADQIDLPQAA
jgi:hypothetical protein